MRGQKYGSKMLEVLTGYLHTELMLVKFELVVSLRTCVSHAANYYKDQLGFTPAMLSDSQESTALRKMFEFSSNEKHARKWHALNLVLPRVGVYLYACFDGSDWYKSSVLETNHTTSSCLVQYIEDGQIEEISLPDPEVLLEHVYLWRCRHPANKPLIDDTISDNYGRKVSDCPSNVPRIQKRARKSNAPNLEVAKESGTTRKFNGATSEASCKLCKIGIGKCKHQQVGHLGCDQVDSPAQRNPKAKNSEMSFPTTPKVRNMDKHQTQLTVKRKRVHGNTTDKRANDHDTKLCKLGCANCSGASLDIDAGYNGKNDSHSHPQIKHYHTNACRQSAFARLRSVQLLEDQADKVAVNTQTPALHLLAQIQQDRAPEISIEGTRERCVKDVCLGVYKPTGEAAAAVLTAKGAATVAAVKQTGTTELIASTVAMPHGEICVTFLGKEKQGASLHVFEQATLMSYVAGPWLRSNDRSTTVELKLHSLSPQEKQLWWAALQGPQSNAEIELALSYEDQSDLTFYTSKSGSSKTEAPTMSGGDANAKTKAARCENFCVAPLKASCCSTNSTQRIQLPKPTMTFQLNKGAPEVSLKECSTEGKILQKYVEVSETADSVLIKMRFSTNITSKSHGKRTFQCFARVSTTESNSSVDALTGRSQPFQLLAKHPKRIIQVFIDLPICLPERLCGAQVDSAVKRPRPVEQATPEDGLPGKGWKACPVCRKLCGNTSSKCSCSHISVRKAITLKPAVATATSDVDAPGTTATSGHRSQASVTQPASAASYEHGGGVYCPLAELQSLQKPGDCRMVNYWWQGDGPTIHVPNNSEWLQSERAPAMEVDRMAVERPGHLREHIVGCQEAMPAVAEITSAAPPSTQMKESTKMAREAPATRMNFFGTITDGPAVEVQDMGKPPSRSFFDVEGHNEQTQSVKSRVHEQLARGHDESKPIGDNACPKCGKAIDDFVSGMEGLKMHIPCCRPGLKHKADEGLLLVPGQHHPASMITTAQPTETAIIHSCNLRIASALCQLAEKLQAAAMEQERDTISEWQAAIRCDSACTVDLNAAAHETQEIIAKLRTNMAGLGDQWIAEDCSRWLASDLPVGAAGNVA